MNKKAMNQVVPNNGNVR